MTWDEEKIKQLQKLWEKGLSTTEIAKKMNVSKNSVVGKVHRLCLKARPSPIKKKDAENTKKTAPENPAIEAEIKEEKITTEVKEKTETTEAKIVVETVQITKENIPAPKNKADKKQQTKHLKLVELDSHTCRWPIGDPRDEDFCFCGKKVRAGQTYCDEHSQVAYVKALSRK